MRFAQVSAPRQHIVLAWLGQAWLGLAWLDLAWLGTHRLLVQHEQGYKAPLVPHNINFAPSSKKPILWALCNQPRSGPSRKIFTLTWPGQSPWLGTPKNNLHLWLVSEAGPPLPPILALHSFTTVTNHYFRFTSKGQGQMSSFPAQVEPFYCSASRVIILT